MNEKNLKLKLKKKNSQILGLQKLVNLFIKENNFNVSMVGDCTSVGYIEGAISDARIAVKEIA